MTEKKIIFVVSDFLKREFIQNSIFFEDNTFIGHGVS